MDMFWQEFSGKLLEFVIALLVAAVVYVGNRAATAFLRWANAQADEVDNVIIGRALEAAIVWAELRLKNIPGPERLAWVMKYLEGKGITIDEAEAEAYFQAMQKSGDLPVPKATPKEAA